ncbi:MAG: hypothetical protein ABUL47_05185, partial [Leifsonia sp.]
MQEVSLDTPLRTPSERRTRRRFAADSVRTENVRGEEPAQRLTCAADPARRTGAADLRGGPRARDA